MGGGCAEHEPCIGESFEFDRRIGLVEYGKLTFVDWVRGAFITATQPTLWPGGG